MKKAPEFRRRLLGWYRQARRELPWRASRDPWRILVSEIMLQQTRVAAVIPYYERFLARFPDAATLAAAPEPELLALWSGLGYYSRARNLRKAARQIAGHGGFPSSYDAIRELAGVGDYTAAAVASIAFSLPHAVLDGNVARVLSRITAEEGDIRAAEVRQRLRSAAQELLDRRAPGDFNQALMELGATLCLPRDPQCLLCPVSQHCRALQQRRQLELPVPRARREPVRLEQTLLVIRRAGRILMWQRPADSSRLAGFWELPDAERTPEVRLGAVVGEFRHTITHHLYRVRVVEARVDRKPDGMVWIDEVRLHELPLATTARKALRICEC